MPRNPVRLALLTAFALLAIAGAGFARASVETFDQLVTGQFSPSEAPALLGPVDAAGRNDWQCAPERAAASRHATAASLPEPRDP
jgi:hypothetical protein